jgi:hypothetical protein
LYRSAARENEAWFLIQVLRNQPFSVIPAGGHLCSAKDPILPTLRRNLCGNIPCGILRPRHRYPCCAFDATLGSRTEDQLHAKLTAWF